MERKVTYPIEGVPDDLVEEIKKQGFELTGRWMGYISKKYHSGKWIYNPGEGSKPELYVGWIEAASARKKQKGYIELKITIGRKRYKKLEALARCFSE